MYRVGMDELLAKSPQERRELWRQLGGTILGGTIGLIGCIVGFLLIVIGGGFIISLFTNALALAWHFVFGG